MRDGKYNPFLHLVPDGDEDKRIPNMPTDVAKALEAALRFSSMVTDAEMEYSRTALMASRLVLMGNRFMDEIAQQHDITVANSGSENYALRAIAAAKEANPEQLAATIQAINQGYDMAMYAFLQAYKLLHALFSDETVDISLQGMGSIARVETPEAELKFKLMTQLQSPKEAERARLLSIGLVEIEKSIGGADARMSTEERTALLARIQAATEALYLRVNEAVKDLPDSWEDHANGK